MTDTRILLIPDVSIAPTEKIAHEIRAISSIVGPVKLDIWPECTNSAEIEIIMMVSNADIDLAQFGQLKAIMTLSAGIDHLQDLSRFPAHIPIVRLVDAGMADQIAEYALFNLLRFHRLDPHYREEQSRKHWEEVLPIRTARFSVGVAGPGVLGARAAALFQHMGYPVSCWSRSHKDIPGIESFAGEQELQPFLSQLNALFVLLPLTDGTRELFNARTLQWMPRGGFIINAGRGELINEQDLIALLDSGHLAGAALDVFHNEPLPPEDPIWDHPKIFITPHIAAVSYPDVCLEHIAANILRIREGKTPEGIVDRKLGY